MTDMTIAQAMEWAKRQLVSGESPNIDARVLLSHVLDCNNTWLMTYPEQQLTSNQQTAFEECIARRELGEPVSYITGTQDFWTLSLKVNEHTLIPRPETELLVETALELVKDASSNILDLGTGTGAIALALASELPKSSIVAVDKVAEAVALAKENANILGLLNVSIKQSHWFEGITPQKFDLIVTNPPYVEANSEWLNRGDVRFEPNSALVAGNDGLDDIRHIIKTADKWLNNNGWLLIEHGFEQSAQIQKTLTEHNYNQVQMVVDHSGLPRVCFAQKTVA